MSFKHGNQREQIAAFEAPSFPPQDEQNRCGQRASDGLAEQGTDKESQRHGVRAGRTEFCQEIGRGAARAQVGEHGSQVEDARQDVLSLGDPGHGFDVDGMNSEDGGGQPRPRDAKSTEDEPQKNGTGRVQQHVDGVVAEGVEPPEVVLDPEGGEDQRIVLRRGTRLGPDLLQAGGRAEQAVLGHIRVVIPDEPGAQGRNVGYDRHQDDQASPEPCTCQRSIHWH
jgi:hypothetical protein